MAFPNVPIAPGVPPLPRIAGAVVDVIGLLTADTISMFGSGAVQQWGLFKDGVPVILADTVLTMDYRQDWTVATFPLEKGAFESYDKVQIPYDVRLRFARGGSDSDRTELLTSVADAAASLDLFDVVSPAAVYIGVNVVHQDYARGAQRGNGLISIDVWVKEMRVNATAAFGNTKTAQAAGGSTTNGSATSATIGTTKSPSAAVQVDDGNVQPSAAPASFAERFGGFT